MYSKQTALEIRDPSPAVRVALLLATVPVAMFAYVTVSGSVQAMTTFHIGAGTLWTAGVVCYGFGVAPLLDGRDTAGRVALVGRTVPFTVTLFPVLAVVTIGAGLQIAMSRGLLFAGGTLISTVLAVSGLIAVLALGVVLPRDITLYRALRAGSADADTLARLGTTNAKLLTIQGTLQLTILFLMYHLSSSVS